MGAIRIDRAWYFHVEPPRPMTDQEYAHFRILPCSSYDGRDPCKRDGEFWLYAPDGEPNPGGNICREHGEATVSQLALYLGERWTLIPIAIHDGIRMDARIEGR